VLGGYLGQLILVVNGISRYIDAHDRPSSKGSASRPLKSPISGRISRTSASKRGTGDGSSHADGDSKIDSNIHPAL